MQWEWHVPLDFSVTASIGVRAPSDCVAGVCRDDVIIRAVGGGSRHDAWLLQENPHEHLPQG